MNKFTGFYELKTLNIPTVPWKIFTPETQLDKDLLWTVRVATVAGDDLNLPRAVGVDHAEARNKGISFLEEYRDKGIVIYYPYFIAQKSGVLDINRHRTVIEAVDRDLWNLVTYGRKNVTAIIPAENSRISASQKGCSVHAARIPFESMTVTGDESFLTADEICELMGYGAVIRSRFRNDITEGYSILAEWSYAYNTGLHMKPSGSRYLVFYELRGVRSF